MKSSYKYFVFLGLLAFLAACSSSSKNEALEYRAILSYEDNFDNLQDFWNIEEITDSTRIEITEDPLNPENNVLIMFMESEDWNAGGKRNEIKVNYDFTFNNDDILSEYSIDFLIPAEFFNDKTAVDWLMIHQWHDKPPLNTSWEDYTIGSKPPVNLFIHVNPSGQHKIVYNYGLWSNDIYEVQSFEFEEPLEADTWYSFENTIKWSLEEDGYSIPKLNGQYLYSENSEGKIQARNCFNDQGNYFKMGLYGYYDNLDNPVIYFDNFDYTLYRKE